MINLFGRGWFNDNDAIHFLPKDFDSTFNTVILFFSFFHGFLTHLKTWQHEIKNKEEKISETNLTKWHVTGEAF